MTSLTPLSIEYEGMVYAVTPRLGAWLEVEDEIGPLPAFHQRLLAEEWRVAEVVTAFQILLQHSGCEADYFKLGEVLRRRGFSACGCLLAALLAVFLDAAPSVLSSDVSTLGGKAA